jgi:nucleotide-binding universal stress UspA family protein
VFDWIEDSLSRMQFSDRDVPCTTSSLDGIPHKEIVDHAKKVGADLILIGTHGRSGLSHAVLGSVAERVVQRARRPVLVVPVGAP